LDEWLTNLSMGGPPRSEVGDQRLAELAHADLDSRFTEDAKKTRTTKGQ
jgi:hypothetical protein